MAKGISGEEAAEIAKSYVSENFGPLSKLQATFERRGRVWVVIVKGGLPPRYMEFEVRVRASDGETTRCVEIS